ncbi:hypothetical protein BVRB_6g144540 isoform B [Beta vulgaris subsp. vulgaris]|nr:hypothetical protein BVRB_6g144540 isoform B [Beta vulgaris subsp. vulgaris]
MSALSSSFVLILDSATNFIRWNAAVLLPSNAYWQLVYNFST